MTSGRQRAAARPVVPRALRFAAACAVAGWVAAACAAPAPRAPAAPAGSSTAPIRDRYARARIEMVAAVNADREGHGLGSVVLDSLATIVAQEHAEEMAALGFLSHYSQDGRTPYQRYASAGGRGHVRENVFQSRGRGGADASSDPWERFDVRVAESWLMASEGHRATILDPHRVRLGVGIAVDRARGAVYLVQEFVAEGAIVEAPGRVVPGQEASVSGRLRATGARPLMLVLAREPAERPWVRSGARPPGGPYVDGGPESVIVPPWAIRWNPTDRSFGLDLRMGRGAEPALWYAVLYLASEEHVRSALAERRADTDAGWPAAAFLLEVL